MERNGMHLLLLCQVYGRPGRDVSKWFPPPRVSLTPSLLFPVCAGGPESKNTSSFSLYLEHRQAVSIFNGDLSSQLCVWCLG